LLLSDFETLVSLAANDAAILQYGYSREEFLSLTLKDLRHPEVLADFLATLPACVPGIRRTSEERHRKKDGTTIEVAVSYELISWGGKRAQMVLAQDITDQRQLQRAFQRTEDSGLRLQMRPSILPLLTRLAISSV
jgi:PAS domain S-box-containing protein